MWGFVLLNEGIWGDRPLGGYVKDAELNLFVPSGDGLAYSDGDSVERHVMAAVQGATDRSVFSNELLSRIVDWPSEYHLSRQRHCLVRPLGIRPGDRVLEIGSGCGAITRYLGELGAQVVAVEGSHRRARITAERCRDLDNVTVLANDITRIRLPQARFDWVLLIGVLEYAPVFVRSERPMHDYLARAVRALAPAGQLVVAIENQLGLKYFNGMDEDHVGKPYYGLQGLYGRREPRTLGRSELTSLLMSQGLESVRYWLPFPDYKLPDVIIADRALSDGEFSPAELLAKVYARDYSGPNHRNFIDPLVLRELAQNRLVGELANSFMAVASRESTAVGNEPLAISFATMRKPQYATETRIVRSDAGLEVQKLRLFPDLPATYASPSGSGRQAVGREKYQPGPLALWRVTEARARGGAVSDIVRALRPWFDFLLERSWNDGADDPKPGRLEDYSIPGRYHDCTPYNVVEGAQGPVFIDREWHTTGELPLGWVVTRSVHSVLVHLPGLGKDVPATEEVVTGLCALKRLSVDAGSIEGWLAIERIHQAEIHGGAPEVAEDNAVPAVQTVEPAEDLSPRTEPASDLLELEMRDEVPHPAGAPAASLPPQQATSVARPDQPSTVKRLMWSAYGFAYRLGGRLLRRALSTTTLLKLRALVPQPHGIPRRLAVRPPADSAAAMIVGNVSPPLDRPDIFVLSIIAWDFRHQRPQHIASGLAQHHRVFYIEMSLDDDGFGVKQVRPNVFSVRLPKQDVGYIDPYVGQPSRRHIQRWLKAFYAFCDAVGSTSQKQVILQHPFWWQFARHLPPEFELTVDCMDDIAGFSNTDDFLLELEEDMIANCDRLVVTSSYLHAKWGTLKRPTIIRNGGALEHFAAIETRRAPPAFLKPADDATGRIQVGYVGAIAEWFHVDLVAAAAAAAPDIDFHLCGGISAAEPLRLGKIPNVTLYGEIPYADVPAFLDNMDVVTIPFQLLPIIKACDPVKFYEYAATGKPTVSTRLPELERASDLVFFADDPQTFVAQIRSAYEKGKDAAFRAKLRAYAENNGWDRRIQQFEAVLGETPKVSAVVLSFGDPSFTAATLSSIFDEGGNYANLEVIIVDNGSTDAQLQRVRATCNAHRNVKLIENGANLGFAAGNNIGIKAATGDFVLLLNNDVYLAPGAIAGMVRHLQKNPSIGAVGPLTNNIGNEARLEVDYADMQQMKQAARWATTGYRGAWTDIQTLAYFAVMFRRWDLDEFGLLPEEYGRGMFEDDDHCETIKSRGFQCALAEDSFVHHHLSATFNSSITAAAKQALFDENKARFEKKWGPWRPHNYRDQRPPSSLGR